MVSRSKRVAKVDWQQLARAVADKHVAKVTVPDPEDVLAHARRRYRLGKVAPDLKLELHARGFSRRSGCVLPCAISWD